MLELLKKIFDVPVKDIEAKLRPVPTCDFGGKAELELEVFTSGKAKMEAEIKRTTIPEGARCEFVVNGQVVVQMYKSGNRQEEHFNFAEHEPHPQLEIGDTVELYVEGKLCYQGTFRRD